MNTKELKRRILQGFCYEPLFYIGADNGPAIPIRLRYSGTATSLGIHIKSSVSRAGKVYYSYGDEELTNKLSYTPNSSLESTVYVPLKSGGGIVNIYVKDEGVALYYNSAFKLNEVIQWGNARIKDISNFFSYGTTSYTLLNASTIFPKDLTTEENKTFRTAIIADYLFAYCNNAVPTFIQNMFLTQKENILYNMYSLESAKYMFMNTTISDMIVSVFSPEKNINIQDISNMFQNCNLNNSKMHKGLFKGLKSLITANDTFITNPSVTEIPEELFMDCENLITTKLLFNRNSILKIKERAFKNCFMLNQYYSTYTSSYHYTMEGVLGYNGTITSGYYTVAYQSAVDGTRITSIEEEAFFGVGKNITGKSQYIYSTDYYDFRHTFSNNKANLQLGENVFSECRIYSLYYTFSNSNIKKIPAGIFKNCKDIAHTTYMFEKCDALVDASGIDSLNSCKALEYVSDMFLDCHHLETIGDLDFSDNERLVGAGYCFAGCYRLKDVSKVSFRNCKSLINVGGLFQYCYCIQEIHPDIFRGCIALSILTEAFSNCYMLKSVPDKLVYDSQAETFSIEYMFIRGVLGFEEVEEKIDEETTIYYNGLVYISDNNPGLIAANLRSTIEKDHPYYKKRMEDFPITHLGKDMFRPGLTLNDTKPTRAWWLIYRGDNTEYLMKMFGTDNFSYGNIFFSSLYWFREKRTMKIQGYTFTYSKFQQMLYFSGEIPNIFLNSLSLKNIPIMLKSDEANYNRYFYPDVYFFKGKTSKVFGTPDYLYWDDEDLPDALKGQKIPQEDLSSPVRNYLSGVENLPDSSLPIPIYKS